MSIRTQSLGECVTAPSPQEVATANAESTYPPPSRPRTGSLRVDTSSLDQPSTAYPSFTAKGDLFSWTSLFDMHAFGKLAHSPRTSKHGSPPMVSIRSSTPTSPPDT
ncbi:hypothetical protein BGW80DRAFT_1460487 [Lactifluus volemus]|nr:hypothetical protein BGW80DRAFT_1460487 [Lactifluus volemus]